MGIDESALPSDQQPWDRLHVWLVRRDLDFLGKIYAASAVVMPAVLLQLKAAGHYTIMCGDGTNDVGALKASHVGIALLSAPLAEDEGESAVQRRVKGADGDSSAPALNKASRPPTLREL